MKSDNVYIFHIIDSMDQIAEYTDPLDYNSFMESRMIQDAVIRNLEVIGEAAKNVSNSTKADHPQIPWKQMAGMRDKLIHNYMGVDLGAVWNTVEKVIPDLKRDLQQIADQTDL
jgi:uncharacterized protein with HEPN domain